MATRTSTPKSEKRKHETSIRIRLLPEHDDLIRRAAQHAGISISDWVRERLLRAARKELPEVEKRGK
jgi:uncharacterized protein (DUF1778 family)